jgi:hypothetical protein
LFAAHFGGSSRVKLLTKTGQKLRIVFRFESKSSINLKYQQKNMQKAVAKSSIFQYLGVLLGYLPVFFVSLRIEINDN